MFEKPSHLLEVARRAASASQRPVVGGVAVFLHGYERTTVDVDLFSDDLELTAAALIQCGAKWDRRNRQHILDGVPVHIVTSQETGGSPASVSKIQGIRVVSLADLIRFKLRSGMASLDRAKDIADVVELIRSVPLDKRFAGRLPREQRSAFKKMVEAVRRAR